MIIIFIFVFLICSHLIISDFLEYKESISSTEQLIQEVVETDDSKQESRINWQYLQERNSGTIAWIEVENTNINYPILKDTNLYYINHSYDKKYNKNGSIFTTNAAPFIDQETIIYGHNMKNGTMFSELGKYLKKDFLDSNNIIKIYTPTGDYECKIFSVYSTCIDDENNNIKSLNFDERIEYYKESSQCSIPNVENISKIIKLSTCSYINAKTTPTDQRYYILASVIPIM